MIARRKTQRRRRWCGRPDCAAALIVGALAGCSGSDGLLVFDAASPASDAKAGVAAPATSSPVAAGPVLAFVAAAVEGQTADFDDPGFGGRVSVVVARTYHAASDRLCRRFVVRNGRDEPSTRAACREGSRWVVVPFAAP